MKIPFGKKVRCGNFYVLKKTRVLSKKEMKELRGELLQNLGRAGLPYIEIGSLSRDWKIEFSAGTDAFARIDGAEVSEGDAGRLLYEGEAERNISHFMTRCWAATSVVCAPDDVEGNILVDGVILNSIGKILDLASKAGSAPLPARENDKVLDEAEADEKARETFMGMSNQIKKEDGDKK